MAVMTLLDVEKAFDMALIKFWNSLHKKWISIKFYFLNQNLLF